MSLDVPLYSIKSYEDLIEEIYIFLAKDLGSRFELVFLQLFLAVKCKSD